MIDNADLTRDRIEQLATREPILAHALKCGRQNDLNWEQMMHLAIILLIQQKTELANAVLQHLSSQTHFVMKLTDGEIANLAERLGTMSPLSAPLSIDQPPDDL